MCSSKVQHRHWRAATDGRLLQHRHRSMVSKQIRISPNNYALGYSTAHIGKWHVGSRNYEMVPNYLEAAGVEDPESVKVDKAGHTIIQQGPPSGI